MAVLYVFRLVGDTEIDNEHKRRMVFGWSTVSIQLTDGLKLVNYLYRLEKVTAHPALFWKKPMDDIEILKDEFLHRNEELLRLMSAFDSIKMSFHCSLMVR